MRFLNTRTGEFVERDPKETEYAILSHVWDSQGEQSYMKLSEIQKRYILQAQCLLHGTKSPPPPTAAPPAPPDFSPLPSSVEHSSSAPGVHQSSAPSVPPTDESAAPSHHPDPAEGGNVRQDNLTTTHTGRPRLSSCLHTVWQFILLVLLFPAYLQPLPSPDPSDPSSTPRDSPIPSNTTVEPSRDTPPCPAEGDQLKTPPCCIWDDPELSPKIRDACRIAREAGYDYLWIDSCCINKSSSSELTESINSMYQWYGHARDCYAYLADVPPGKDPRLPWSKFHSSRWFTRGWTLQELIAPSKVKFLSNDWSLIGTKLTLVDVIEETTTIPREALLRLESLDVFSVAERLSWAARRETTRVEDRAYSLFGIFDINMPTLYGEGERAFRRLQEEILRRFCGEYLTRAFLRGDSSTKISTCTKTKLLSPWYTAELRRPDEGHPTTHWLTLSGKDHTITVEYQHTLEDDGRELTVEAHVKMSRHALDDSVEIKADPSSVSWTDGGGSTWYQRLNTEEVTFTLTAMTAVGVRLGLDWAAPSHYFLYAYLVNYTLIPSQSSTDHNVQVVRIERHEGSEAGGKADGQEIGDKAGASDSGRVLWNGDDALPPPLGSDGIAGRLETCGEDGELDGGEED
ncbi:hypothetical protein BD309DRAFT_1084867 [Dichomitus squalens]|nr:hypothetical protein BD309DRAFT_1084867 [Dichomitus squalens]